jgi:hypothetical protein
MGNDLEIEIRPGTTPGKYEVEVDSPAGTASGKMRLDADAILDRRRELAASVLASSVTSRSSFSTLERPVRDVGLKLFKALFAGPVYGRYTASLQEAASRGEPLRVVLRLRVPELAGIPWETLFDPESREYLCQREPLVRYVDAAQPSTPLAASGPLRILGMVSAPTDLERLDTTEERRRLEDSVADLRDQGALEMVWVESGTWGALQHKLMAGPWHVVHFVGHGGMSAEGGVLALEDENTGKAALVSAVRFARLLHACRPVPRLVVLNSCSSGESAADDLLSSTAAALVHSGISAAVAMQFAVTDPAALAFSRGFYQALAHNIAVDEAVRLGRIAIDGTSEQTLEWVTPVVYLRTDDTRLFELKEQAQGAPRSLPEEEDIAQEATKHGLYVQALAAVRKAQYDDAVALLDSLVTLDPAYRDAAELRGGIRRDQRLETEYAAARAAEDRGDWDAARRGFGTVLAVKADYRDTQARHDACQRRLDVVSLQDELRVHAQNDDWVAVLAVSGELAKLDPEAADPEGLATWARELVTGGPEEAGVEEAGAQEDWSGEERSEEDRSAADRDATKVLPAARDVEPWPPEVTEGARPAEEPVEVRETSGDEGGGRRRRMLTWAVGIGVPVVVAAAVIGFVRAGDGGGAGNGGKGTPTAEVTCWDGETADSRSSCAVPKGRAGLQTVFPSMDASCHQGDVFAEGKVELFECVYDGYTIKYSRWEKGADRYAFFDKNNSGARRAKWYIEGTFAGRTWTGLDERPDQSRPFRWLATYRTAPFEVLVQGVDEESRAAGRDRVAARPPEEIGLR